MGVSTQLPANQIALHKIYTIYYLDYDAIVVGRIMKEMHQINLCNELLFIFSL